MKIAISFFLISILCWPISAQDMASLINSVNVFRDKGKLTTEIKFDGGQITNQPVPEFINKSIQFDLTGIQLPVSSRSIKLKDKIFKNIYLYNLDSNTVRVRYNSKKIKASVFAKKFDLQPNNSKVRLQILENTEIVKAKKVTKKKKAKVAKKSKQKTYDLLSSKAKLSSGDAQPEASLAALSSAESLPEKKDLPESEIPLKLSAESNGSTESVAGDNYYKLVFTLAALFAGMLLILAFFKKWKKISGVETGVNNIKLLSQHHLGPKKSLCVIPSCW